MLMKLFKIDEYCRYAASTSENERSFGKRWPGVLPKMRARGPENRLMLKRLRARAARLRNVSESQPRIVFFHLPRTGGTSLAKDILFPNFPKSRWCHVNFGPDMQPLGGAHDPLTWPAWRRKRIRVLAGHMPFGFAEHFPGPSEYVTLIRDPIARTISDYYFCRNNPSNPAHGAAAALSLVEFVRRGCGTSENCYARWLSNAAWGAVYRDRDEMLGAAMKNLSQFSWIGPMEEFKVSVDCLCQKYGYVPRSTTDINRNGATPEARRLSAEERQALRRANELDLIIYEECRRRFIGGTPCYVQGPLSAR